MTYTHPAILVVDDDLDTCNNMSDILSDHGYRVDTAVDGHAALRLVRRTAYDLALFDLKMPGMDGLTLCRQAGRLCPAMASLLITAYQDDILPGAASAAGVRQILAKPVDIVVLLAAIKQNLAG